MSARKSIWGFIIKGFALILLLIALGIQVSGHSYFWNALALTYLHGHSTAHIDDANDFVQRKIEAGSPQAWPKAKKYNQIELANTSLDYLNQYKTAAFLVAQNGELLYERYFAPYTAQSATNSFSMAKTVTTMQVGIAIQQGLIQNFNDPIANYIPEFKQDELGKTATLAQFSAMTAGLNWSESYKLPLNETTALYYGSDAKSVVLNRGFERQPGSAFEYSSGTTQVLGIALQNALQAKNPQATISQHLSETLWKPLGMEQSAIYTLDRAADKGGMERAYCCIFSNAKDFAKLGQLLLQDGQWQGKTILDKDFVEKMRQPGLSANYGHSLWMDWKYQHPFYLLQGHQGQYVIVVPKQKLVIVRLGQFRNKTMGSGGLVQEIYDYIDAAVLMAEKAANQP